MDSLAVAEGDDLVEGEGGKEAAVQEKEREAEPPAAVAPLEDDDDVSSGQGAVCASTLKAPPNVKVPLKDIPPAAAKSGGDDRSDALSDASSLSSLFVEDEKEKAVTSPEDLESLEQAIQNVRADFLKASGRYQLDLKNLNLDDGDELEGVNENDEEEEKEDDEFDGISFASSMSSGSIQAYIELMRGTKGPTDKEDDAKTKQERQQEAASKWRTQIVSSTAGRRRFSVFRNRDSILYGSHSRPQSPDVGEDEPDPEMSANLIEQFERKVPTQFSELFNAADLEKSDNEEEEGK